MATNRSTKSNFTGKVTLYLRVLRGKTRAYVPVVFIRPNRLRPGYGLVDGKEQHFADGVYAIRYTHPDRGRSWEAVGTDPELALIAKQRKELALNSFTAGLIEQMPEPESRATRTPPVVTKFARTNTSSIPEDDRVRIDLAMDDFLTSSQRRNAERTQTAYRNHLRLFLDVLTFPAPKIYLDEITRYDIERALDASREGAFGQDLIRDLAYPPNLPAGERTQSCKKGRCTEIHEEGCDCVQHR